MDVELSDHQDNKWKSLPCHRRNIKELERLFSMILQKAQAEGVREFDFEFKENFPMSSWGGVTFKGSISFGDPFVKTD